MADKDSSNHTNMFPLCEINGSKAATASRSIQHAFTRAIGININRKDLFKELTEICYFTEVDEEWSTLLPPPPSPHTIT